jgi:hypothetical protein
MEIEKTIEEEKKNLFLVIANSLSILFLLQLSLLIFSIVKLGMNEFKLMLLFFISIPILVGGSYLFIIIAKIRGEKPLWAYITAITLPNLSSVLISIVYVRKEELIEDVLVIVTASLFVTAIGFLSFGVGCLINKFIVKEKNILSNSANSRFIIKTAKFISIIISCPNLIIMTIDHTGSLILFELGMITIISLILLFVSDLKSERPNFIDAVIVNCSILTSIAAAWYFSLDIMVWIFIFVLLLEPFIYLYNQDNQDVKHFK